MAPMESTTKKMWVNAGIVVLIFLAVGGIYIYKNSGKSSNIGTTLTEDKNKNTMNDYAPGTTEQVYSTKTKENINQDAKTNIKGTVKAKQLPKLVDLGADTCIPCKKLAPILQELKKEYKDKLDVEVIDIYEQEELTDKYNRIHPIRVIPTQILFDANGKEVWSHEGFIEKEDLKKVFTENVEVE